MDSYFLFKCFLAGFTAASAGGPVFILTFNNGAMRGFFTGFLTAFGAALGDGFLLFLGLIGTLNFFDSSNQYYVAIDLVGGALLILLGLSMIFSKKTPNVQASSSQDSHSLAIAKPFLATVLNPLAIFAFMFISTQVFDGDPNALQPTELLMGCFMTGIGSLSVLGSIAFAASTIGSALSHQNLKRLSSITGSIVLAIGLYFCFDAVKIVFFDHYFTQVVDSDE